MKTLLLIALTVIALAVWGATATLAAPVTTVGQTTPGAPDPSIARQTAAQLFTNSQYELATQTYQKLLDQGFADAELYRNLAAAAYQSGNLEQALWSLRLAQEFAPRDGAITADLAKLQSELAALDAEVQVVAEAGLLSQIGNASAAWFSLNELAVLALALWTGFVVLLLAMMLGSGGVAMHRWARFAAVAVGLLLIVSLVTMVSRLQIYQELVSAAIAVA